MNKKKACPSVKYKKDIFLIGNFIKGKIGEYERPRPCSTRDLSACVTPHSSGTWKYRPRGIKAFRKVANSGHLEI